MYEQDSNDPVEPEPRPEVHVHADGDSVKWIMGGAVMIVGFVMAGLYGIAKQPDGASKLEAIGEWFHRGKKSPEPGASTKPELPADPPIEIE